MEIKQKLTIELVPETAWFSNVRSQVSKKEWDILRKDSYVKANNLCEICGGKGRRHPVECHEVWHYDDDKKIQTLVRLISLCPSCHQVKHIGLAKVRGRYKQALTHLAKVNQWQISKAEKYVNDQFQIWLQRSQFEWTLDISFLKNFGIKCVKP